MTYQEFWNKYKGQSKGYPEGQYVGECLSIVKLYIKECFGINPPPSGTNSAYGYWSNFPSPLDTVFEKVENTDELIPVPGWIAIWQPWSSNPYGHIAIVAEGSTTGTLKNYAQNWTSKIFQLESNRYTNVVGFLKPKVINSDDNMTDQEKIMLEFIRSNKITEGQLRQGYGYIADNIEEKVTALEKLSYNLNEKVKELEETLAEEHKIVVGWQNKWNTANAEIKDLQAKLLSAPTLTPWQHIRLGIKLLIKQSK